MYSHTILVQRSKKREGRNYFYNVKKFLKQESLVKSNKKKNRKQKVNKKRYALYLQDNDIRNEIHFTKNSNN